ncbi:MAG: hypothetical protein COS89_05140, partial [Deltaproteobacteria bacterium CG07_land_8_20_14_0_80_38_7]
MDKPTTKAPTDERTIISSLDNDEERTPSEQAKKPPYLIIIEGPHAGGHFQLFQGKNIIGRSNNCAVQLQDHSVSRNHVEIEKGEAGWMIRDLGSKNGTYVNGGLISDTVVFGHKDVIKVGIYILRLVTQTIKPEEEMEIPSDFAIGGKTVLTESPNSPDGLTSEMAKKDIPKDEFDEEGNVKDKKDEEVKAPASLSTRLRKTAIFVVGSIGIIACVGYLTWHFFLHPSGGGKGVKPPVKLPEAVVDPQSMPATDQLVDMPQVPTQEAVPQKVPVFLDFASSPLPSTISFQDKELGKAPLRVNVELESGKEYTATAVFYMQDMQESYTLPVKFKVTEGESVIPILFRAPIGMLKVNDLPRDVQFYLEGVFEYDRFKEKPAKLNEIVLKKPIYIPYGKYTVELRKSRQLGESQTYVQDIIFKREFTIAEDQPTYILDIKEEDLKVFPVEINSTPQQSDVFVDGKLMGKTPYKGLFPLGEHTLTLRKEGYFEHSQLLKVDINTEFISDIKLETSVAGAHLNNANAMMSRELYQEAVNELAQALASNPAPSEVGQANYLLGSCYLKLGDIERSLTYFGLSQQTEDWKYPSMLGKVAAYAIVKRVNDALPLLVDVMLNAKDESIKRQANDLFQQMSPFRSVIYAYTDPAGAK